jgi:general secretion pathway protein E/type IV pilus assembly protein PilB
VASALRAIMAQRLVRTICPHCKESYRPPQSEIRLLGPMAAQAKDVEFFRGHGCAHCSLTGYSGRAGIFEIFLINDEIQKMIFEKKPANELRIRARELGMRTLREDGMRKVLSGLTTLDEILKVTMGDAE